MILYRSEFQETQMVARDVDLPPIWLAGFALLARVAGGLWPIAFAHDALIGAVLVLMGLALMLGAAAQLVLARTAVIPGRDPKRMLTKGLFRLSRNPIYLGDAIFLAGLTAYWDAWVAMPMVFAFIALINHRFIRPEEARLHRLFGDAFAAYKKRTRRWI